MNTAKKVIFITGAEHSGITMLGKMLSTLEGALFAGEMQHCRLKNRLECLTCGPDCPVWKDFDWHHGDSAHESVAQKSGRSIIIDSTRQPVSWIAEQAELLMRQGTEWALVLLTRDPRAVIARRWQKNPSMTVVQHAERWFRETGAREKLFRNLASSGPTIRIRYEELAIRPAETLQAICAGIGLPFDERMLDQSKAHQHRLAGSLGKKELIDDPLPTAAKLNERWQQELDETAKRQIEETAGELFSSYKWEV